VNQAFLLLLALLSCSPASSGAAPVPVVRSALGLAADPPVLPVIPSILVIVADDFGWTERPFMPALDALAAQGVTFTRCYGFPVCSPSRYAALAGRLPRREGIGDVINAYNTATGASPPPDRKRVLLSEALLPTRITALFGKWHLGRLAEPGRVDLLLSAESGPFGSGFEVWRGGNHNAIAQGPSATGYTDWVRVRNHDVATSYATYATDEQRAEFLDWWIDNAALPRFAWLAWSAPHQPYDTPPGYLPSLTTRAQYLDVVDYLDGALATVLASVDLLETIVVFFGDNGTPDDARQVGSPSGFWKGTTYEGGVRLPFIIAGPGIAQGVTSPRLVSLLDLPATLLELVGETSRGFEDSQSFANALGAYTGSLARSWVFTERYDVPAAGFPVEGYDDVAVIESQWKYRSWDADGVGPGGKQDAIYYLPNDPFEQNPLDPTDPLLAVVAARLQAALASVPPRL
jgi:arylsulfatase A-like enzyme